VTVNGVSFETPVAPSGGHEFHLFLDGSVAEVIVNRRHAITSRIYRQPNGALHVKLGADSKVASLNAWLSRPISSDRRTT
jgi:Glycosyl hydrolases family 32 C terminal